MTTSQTGRPVTRDRKSTRLNSSHRTMSYAVFCLKKKKALDARCVVVELRTRKPGTVVDRASVVCRIDLPSCHVPTPFLPPIRDALLFFFFNATATIDIYTIPLPDALPI